MTETPHRWQPAGHNEAGDPMMARVPVVPEAAAPEAGTEGDYSEMTKDELQAILESRGLAKSGTKDELIARLNA